MAKMIIENRRFEGMFPINIFDTTLLHFKVKLRQGHSGYVLTLDWIKENSMFPTANIIIHLQPRHIESKPYIFAELESPPMFDPTLLNTFIANNFFNIQIKVKNRTTIYTLWYRQHNMAGYVKMHTPDLDITEAQIFDDARRNLAGRQRRQDYGSTNTSYDGPRQQLRNTFVYSDDLSHGPRDQRHYHPQPPYHNQYLPTSSDYRRNHSLPPQYSVTDPLLTPILGQQRVGFQAESQEQGNVRDRNDM